MKIAVIFTGGTIGSCIKNDFISVDNRIQYVLLKEFENDGEIIFDTTSPYSILSENLSAKELNLLQKEIACKLSQDFDGIIVTHGSDTLQYTSTAIEYAFGNCNKPVVFVAADYPLEDSRSNGYANFRCAVEFIKEKISNGVFVSYKNDDEAVINIHIPSKILTHNELNANIYSIDKIPFAQYDGKFTVNYDYSGTGNGIVNYSEASQILVVSSTPADNYSYFLENVKAIIFKPYHSGTLNTSNEKLVDFCKSATDKQISMYVLGTNSENDYESTRIYKDLNINVLPYGTFISAYIRLWANLSNN